MDQETDDNVMDTSPDSYRDSDCVNPSVTHQYTDDIMDNPRVTNQEPDDVLENPPIKHDEKHTETLHKDSDDPVMPDSTTKVEFHIQPTSVPFTSPDQDPEVKTSYKAHEDYKDNVKPVEEGSNLEPDDHGDPDLTFALFGSSEAVQFGCDNILLGEKQPCLKNTEFPVIISIQRKISEHHVSVINMIGSHETDLEPLDNVIGHLVNESEIHAFIFVVRLEQLTDEGKMGIEWLQRIFGDKVLSSVIILFTYEQEEECDTIIDDLKNNSVLEQLLDKCGGRYHSCSKNMNNQSEMRELIDRIKQLFTDNNQQFYTREIHKPSEDLQNSECQSGNIDPRFLSYICHNSILTFSFKIPY